MTPTLPPGAPVSPAPVNVSSALRTVPSPMPVTSKLISVTAPCGPDVNTVVSDTASKVTSVVTLIAPATAGSTPVSGNPGTEGGNITSPGASGTPGPVVTGAASVVSRGTPL